MTKSIDKLSINDILEYEVKLHKILAKHRIEFIMTFGDIGRLIAKRVDTFKLKIVLVTEDLRWYKFSGVSELFRFLYKEGYIKVYPGHYPNKEIQINNKILEILINKIDSKSYYKKVPENDFDS